MLPILAGEARLAGAFRQVAEAGPAAAAGGAAIVA